MSDRGAAKSDGLDPARIVRAGREAGLTACGIATLGPSGHAARLDAWLARGAHGSMGWMERTAPARRDPRTKWTWARTALVAAVSYLSEPVRRADATGIARYVSRYARGRDYHEILKERLRAWGDAVEREAGRPHRRVALVDTSAVMERELAERAGLGWIGKNTCLIGPEGDSWRFIGVLLTDLELGVEESRAAERCGTCRACLDACPTDAFTGPWELDARRCISYLTIEHRDAIPGELRSGMGDWLFGCDVCQEVCPWNRRVEPVADAGFETAEPLARTTLAQLAAMGDEEIRAAFRGTPITRPRRRGLVRNALIVAANAGDEAALAVAGRLVEDDDPVVRETARWAVERGRGDPGPG